MKQMADLPHLPLLWLCLFLGHHPLQVIFRKAGHYWPSTFVALVFLKNVLACDSIAIFFTCPNDSWSTVVFDALNVEAVLRKAGPGGLRMSLSGFMTYKYGSGLAESRPFHRPQTEKWTDFQQ